MPKHTVIQSRNDHDNLSDLLLAFSNIIVTDFPTPANLGSVARPVHITKLGRSWGVPALANYHDREDFEDREIYQGNLMSIRKVDKKSSLLSRWCYSACFRYQTIVILSPHRVNTSLAIT